jgi:negative regulator of flagellin synthesis FlgM
MKIQGDSAVSNKINGLEAKPTRVAPASPVNRRADGPADMAGKSASDTDVHLTGTARGLAALEQSVRSMPSVDEVRVAAVQDRLRSGSYTIDPQRVADRLLRLEVDLRQVRPQGHNPLR